MSFATAMGPVMTVRSAAILTTSYVGTTALQSDGGHNQAVFLIDFTIGSLTDVLVKAQMSADGSTWFDAPIKGSGTTSGSEYQQPLLADVGKIAATGTYVYQVPMLGLPYCRLALKGEGTTTSSSATVYAFKGTT